MLEMILLTQCIQLHARTCFPSVELALQARGLWAIDLLAALGSCGSMAIFYLGNGLQPFCRC